MIVKNITFRGIDYAAFADPYRRSCAPVISVNFQPGTLNYSVSPFSHRSWGPPDVQEFGRNLREAVRGIALSLEEQMLAELRNMGHAV